MARLQLILPLLFWGLWVEADDRSAGRWADPLPGTATYFAALLGVVLIMRLVARQAMRRTTSRRVDAVPRFHRLMTLARCAVLGLNALSLYALGFGDAVVAVVPGGHDPRKSVAALVSVVPTVVAWLGLLWTQYPIDRGVREQNALFAFEYGEPVHAVPTLGQYLVQALRTQVLFTLVPVAIVWTLRDLMFSTGRVFGWSGEADADGWVTLLAAGTMFLLAPEVLRRVLPTEPLPPSPVRERLDALCGRLRLRYRDILLWHTHHALANAAVMGLVPRVRYVLMTDLLLETMTTDQVEAVFAHELGHVVKRHMLWYVAFVGLFVVGCGVGESLLAGLFDSRHWPWPSWGSAAATTAGLAAFFVLFGMLSRSFERQADAFAAAALTHAPAGDAPGRDGAALFNSALRHVARLNNMPLDAGSLTRGRPLVGRWVGRFVHHAATWLHGSIRSRMEHLTALTERPATAVRFEQQMLAVRCVLLVGLGATAAWTIVQMAR